MVISRDELAELDPKKTRAIEIQDFVDLDEIDPIYFDHPYYLGPDKGAEKAYALLVKAMEDARKVAIARFVLRNKENLAAIRADGRRADDGDDALRRRGRLARASSTDVLARGRAEGAEKRELEMAKQLIDSLTTDFDAGQVPRRVPRGAARPDRAQGRGQGASSAPPTEEPKPTKAPDLMAALEESLAAVKGEELRRRRRRRRSRQEARSRRRSKLRPTARSRSRRAQARADREARPRAAASRGRRARAQADQPRQGPLPEGRVHQGRGDRLLRADRRRRSCPTCAAAR